MKTITDISGQAFGRLVAIEPTGQKRWGVSLWRCACECGGTHIAAVNSLKSGLVRSCGCLLKDTARAKQTRHGEYKTPTYRSWANMIQRCCNPNSKLFERYGGAGINVCEAWRSYESFKRDMGERPLGTSIDRIDPAGNYEPGNCRWATSTMQARNKIQPPTSFELAEEVRRLYSYGISPKEIGRILELTRGVVHGILYQRNLSIP